MPIPREKRHEVAWSQAEDNLLKELAEKSFYNWRLIADSFNSSRLTISTERRSPLDCQTRWRLRWAPNNRHLAGTSDHHQASSPSIDQSPIIATSSSQMTTRGIRRLATTNLPSVSSPLSGNPVSTESKKRRKHNLVGEVTRRSSKKREIAVKANCKFHLLFPYFFMLLSKFIVAARKQSNTIHESPAAPGTPKVKYNPQELSRIRSEATKPPEQDEARRQANARLQLVRKFCYFVTSLTTSFISATTSAATATASASATPATPTASTTTATTAAHPVSTCSPGPISKPTTSQPACTSRCTPTPPTS